MSAPRAPVVRRIACLYVDAPSPAAVRDLLDVGLAHSPRVEEGALGAVYVDATGLSGLFGDEPSLARRLLEAAGARGHAVRVGIATSRASARFACRLGAGPTVIEPGRDAAFLAPAPVALLDLDEAMAARLDRWGIRTLGELAALPAAALVARLGAEGPRLQALARGEDPRPLRPWSPPLVLEEAIELDDAVTAMDRLAEPVARLAARIGERLARGGHAADQLEWSCRLVDRRRHEGHSVPAFPVAEPAAIAALVRTALEARPPAAAVEAIALRARPARVAPPQESLVDPARPSPRLVTATLARLAALVGAPQIGVPVPLDTHRPDAVDLAPYRSADGLAEGLRDPGDTARAALALRRFRPPVPARVALVAGRPVELHSRRLTARIVVSAGPWRVSGDWWTDRSWLRDEWDVELGERLAGVVCRLGQDGSTWWLDGVYD